MKPHLPRRFAVAATTVLAVGLLAGCEGNNDHNSSTGSHNGSATPTASAPANEAFNAADVAFATDMIPHHQQALEMAQVAETRASNTQVKDIAGRIRQAQDPEIATMAGWLREWGQPVPSSSPGMGLPETHRPGDQPADRSLG